MNSGMEGLPANDSKNTTKAGMSSLSEFGLIHTPVLLGRFVAIR
jgi:hypothetical protein